MPLPRNRQISLIDTPYYHCMSRCVRHAYLCGEDKLTGTNYEHRRQWVEDRLLFLSTVFCIDVCAYAVMSNHTHVVLHVDKHQATQLTDLDVVKRWLKLHKSTLLVQRFASGGELTQAELLTLAETIGVYRKRLFDISWFMRELNEVIGRKANTEDKCTGHFWEGRFKSQALLDEHALAACLVYVDLNPIRAKMADTPEVSHHTSIRRRIQDAKRGFQPSTLMPFVGNLQQQQPKGLSFALIDYIQLVEMTGRASHPKKRGMIDENQSPILHRLGINQKTWDILSQQFETSFSVAAGNVTSLKTYARHTKRSRPPNAKIVIH